MPVAVVRLCVRDLMTRVLNWYTRKNVECVIVLMRLSDVDKTLNSKN